MEELKTSLKDLIKTSEKNTEIDISLSDKTYLLSLQEFSNIITYLKIRNEENSLDLKTSVYMNAIFNYNYDKLCNYRITVNDLDNINSIINKVSHRKNTYIFTILYNNFKENYDGYSGDKKTRSINDIIDLKNYGLRLRKSKENNLDMNNYELKHTDENYITYRIIKRASLTIKETSDYIFKLDISQTITSNNLKNINNKSSKYEIEFDITFKNKLDDDKKVIKLVDIIIEEFANLLRIIQRTESYILPYESDEVIQKFMKLVTNSNKTYIKDLPFMQAESIELYSLIENLPNNYSITDKADGERYALYINEGNIYLISNNLKIMKLNIKKNGIDKYNETVLDGELIFLPEKKKFLYLTFDCLYFKNENVANEPSHSKRLINNRFICELLFDQKVFSEKFYDFKDKDNEKNILEFYEKNIKDYLKDLNERVNNKKNNIIIATKYFIFPFGIELIKTKKEIYSYIELMWRLYTDSSLNPNYLLDGLIATPVNQIHTRVRSEIKHKIYKIKFKQHNTIDFYVEFYKDENTGKIASIYDDSYANDKNIKYEDLKNVENVDLYDFYDKGKNYAIAYLHVGKVIGSEEHPVLFQEDRDNHKAFIFIQDGHPRDNNNDIILDKTVVEFSYNDNPLLPSAYRWVPLRTRHDKTEFMRNYKRKYGNNQEVSEKIWKSIVDGIEFSDIKMLSDTETYEKHLKTLQNIISNDKDNINREVYYNKITKLAKSLREFHNFIKSLIIYTYAGIKNNKKLEVLDYGCGKGGDIMKFYHSKAKECLCFDVDYTGINSGPHSAIKKYQKLKKTYPDFPNMVFFQADGSLPLEFSRQKSVVNNDHSIKILEKFFDKNPKKYDYINVQFTAHYYFENENSLKNFMDNLEKYTRPSGYVAITCFDGDLVNEAFKDKDVIDIEYTDKGVVRTVFKVIKKYDKYEEKVGKAIDVHLPVFNDDTTVTEYLVPKKLMISEMKKRNFRLVERETFKDIFDKLYSFFNDYSHLESNEQNKQYYSKAKKYYDKDDSINLECYKYTNLNVFYIFQKKD